MAQQIIRSINTISEGGDGLEVLSNVEDQFTGEYITFKQVSEYDDGTPMTDAKLDPLRVVYIKKFGNYYKRVLKDLDVNWFGARADGSTDNTAAFNSASEMARVLKCPISVPAGSLPYVILGQVDVYNPIRGNSTIIHGGGNGSTMFVIKGDNVTIEGLKVEMFITGSSQSAPTVISHSSSSTEIIKNLKVSGNEFKNCRFTIRNTTDKYIEGVTFSLNTISCNFQGLPLFDVQNDILNFQGVSDLKILGNTIEAVETNRVIKVQSSVAALPANSDGIIINSNYIKATGRTVVGDSSKQIVDLFNNTSDVIFTKNIIKSKDYTAILEDKSSSYNSYKVRSYSIEGNVIENNNPMIYINGSYSRTDFADDARDYTIIKSTGNIFNNTASLGSGTTHPLVEYRFIDELSLINDTYNCPNGSFNGSSAATRTYNIKKLDTSHCNFNNCIPSIGTIAAFLGSTYNPKYEVISFTDNAVDILGSISTNTLNIAGQAASIGTIDNLNIVNNVFNNPGSTTSFRAIRITNLNVGKSTIYGNKTDSVNPSQILETGSTFESKIQFINSWTTGEGLPIELDYFSTDFEVAATAKEYVGDLNLIPKGNYSAGVGSGSAGIPAFIGLPRGFISFGTLGNGGQFIAGTNSVGFRRYSSGEYGGWMDMFGAASETSFGLVKKSTAVENIQANDATDLETVLVLANELKSKLNSKLNADRSSDQQAT